MSFEMSEKSLPLCCRSPHGEVKERAKDRGWIAAQGSGVNYGE